MIYAVDFSSLPYVAKAYSVRRRTVWQVTDPYTILMYIKEGRCAVTADGEDYILNTGDMLLIPVGQRYIRRPVENEMCTIFYVHMRLSGIRVLSEDEALSETEERKKELAKNFLEGEDSPFYTIYIAPHIKCRPDTELASLCEKVRANFVKNHIESSLLTALAAGELLSRANRVTLDLLGNMSVDRTRVSINLRRAIGFIRANYKEKITLTDLCRAAAVSPQQMIRYFKSELSATPGRYINEVKIDRAKELFLTHPDLSVAEIASELGFPDPQYFTRLFKKLSGETPTGYKKRVHSFDEKKQ